MDVPGGHAAVALWEALLEQRVSEPASFILELLRRDGGRPRSSTTRSTTSMRHARRSRWR